MLQPPIKQTLYILLYISHAFRFVTHSPGCLGWVKLTTWSHRMESFLSGRVAPNRLPRLLSYPIDLGFPPKPCTICIESHVFVFSVFFLGLGDPLITSGITHDGPGRKICAVEIPPILDIIVFPLHDQDMPQAWHVPLRRRLLFGHRPSSESGFPPPVRKVIKSSIGIYFFIFIFFGCSKDPRPCENLLIYRVRNMFST